MMAVLSTEAEAIKLPSVAQQISYTSSRWPLESRGGRGKGEKEDKKFKGRLRHHTLEWDVRNCCWDYLSYSQD